MLSDDALLEQLLAACNDNALETLLAELNDQALLEMLADIDHIDALNARREAKREKKGAVLQTKVVQKQYRKPTPRHHNVRA